MERKLIVGITIGDYNGIAAEVIIKTLEDERMFRLADFVIYGHKSVISYYAKAIKAQHFQVHEISEIDKLNPKIGNLITCWDEQVNITPGEATSDAGAKALIALERGTADLVAGKIDVLVTGPLNKETVNQHLPDFKGQTEYITAKAGSDTSMMLLVSDKLRVGLVSNHLSLKDVPSKIDMPLIIAKLELLNKTLRQDFLISKPKIAVLGLNPHSGDNGLLGKEEKEIIAPAVIKARDKGIVCMGPYPADGFFGAGSYMKFDAVLAMYHDQGLIPFKTIAFGSGVNYTAGISVIRTSPDHGTGYDIVGKDIASTDSLRAAIFEAIDIYHHRAQYKEMTANPIEKVRLSDDRDA
jgi:4-hydroxythreonine-4-phosphate dehydrogenase